MTTIPSFLIQTFQECGWLLSKENHDYKAIWPDGRILVQAVDLTGEREFLTSDSAETALKAMLTPGSTVSQVYSANYSISCRLYYASCFLDIMKLAASRSVCNHKMPMYNVCCMTDTHVQSCTVTCCSAHCLNCDGQSCTVACCSAHHLDCTVTSADQIQHQKLWNRSC